MNTTRLPRYTIQYYIDRLSIIPEEKFTPWEDKPTDRTCELLPNGYFNSDERKDFLYVIAAHYLLPRMAKAAYVGNKAHNGQGYFQNYSRYGYSPKERLLKILKEHSLKRPYAGKSILVNNKDLKRRGYAEGPVYSPAEPSPTDLSKFTSFRLEYEVRAMLNIIAKISHSTYVNALNTAIIHFVGELPKLFPLWSKARLRKAIKDEMEALLAENSANEDVK